MKLASERATDAKEPAFSKLGLGIVLENADAV